MKAEKIKSVELPADLAVETILPIEVAGVEQQLAAHAFLGEQAEEQVLVLVHRNPEQEQQAVPLVRVHSGCVTGDIFHSLRCDCHEQLQVALRAILEVPLGAIVYVPYHEGRGIGLFRKIQAYALQDQGLDTVDANIEAGMPVDSRDYRLAAHALIELGMHEINLLSNNPAKEEALVACGIKVVERTPIVVKPNKHNARYLETKRQRMSHRL